MFKIVERNGRETVLSDIIPPNLVLPDGAWIYYKDVVSHVPDHACKFNTYTVETEGARGKACISQNRSDRYIIEVAGYTVSAVHEVIDRLHLALGGAIVNFEERSITIYK